MTAMTTATKVMSSLVDDVTHNCNNNRIKFGGCRYCLASGSAG